MSHNPGRNNEIFWKYIKIFWQISRSILAAAAILVAIAIAYGTLRERVNTNQTTINRVQIKADANERAIVELRTDVKYIKQGVDDIKAKLNN